MKMALGGDGQEAGLDSQASSGLRRRSDGTPTRVLLVEDDFLVASEVEHGLKEGGYDVVGIAASANEAETMARSLSPDLIVMDIRLKGVRDGVDAALEIFKELGVRSLFASAHADSQTRARAAAAEPLGWLQKPYTGRALIGMINNILRD